MNKFKQFANIEWKNIQSAKDGKLEDSPKATPMQKVATMLVHIIERKAALPNHHAGLPERLTNDIRESFWIMDRDGDGILAREDLECLVYKIDPEMTEEEMSDLLDTADLDGDGRYDMDEYLFLMYLKWNDQESMDDIKEAFRVFDQDNSGSLSRQEFAYILKRLGEPLTDEEVDEILDHFDRDGSGEIDFDEFAYVMTGPHLEDDSTDSTGIPFRVGKKQQTVNQLGRTRRILATPISRSESNRNLISSLSVPSLDESKLEIQKTEALKHEKSVPRRNSCVDSSSGGMLNIRQSRRSNSITPGLSATADLMRRLSVAQTQQSGANVQASCYSLVQDV